MVRVFKSYGPNGSIWLQRGYYSHNVRWDARGPVRGRTLLRAIEWCVYRHFGAPWLG
jgi:hypothetical protein